MNENFDPHPLLEDVLREAAPVEFRRDLLRQTLGEVRHRKRVRARTRNLIIMAIAVGFPFALWNMTPPPDQPCGSESSALRVVHSEPLRPGMVVETRLGAAGTVVSSLVGVVVVETGPRAQVVREIDDAELLAMAEGRPAALVRRSPGQAEFVLLNPSDQNGFPVQ